MRADCWLPLASLQKLHGDDGSFGGDGDQLEKPVGRADLAVFELESRVS